MRTDHPQRDGVQELAGGDTRGALAATLRQLSSLRGGTCQLSSLPGGRVSAETALDTVPVVSKVPAATASGFPLVAPVPNRLRERMLRPEQRASREKKKPQFIGIIV